MSKKINIYKTIDKLIFENNEVKNGTEFTADEIIVSVSESGSCSCFTDAYEGVWEFDEKFKEAVDDALNHGKILIARYFDKSSREGDLGFVIDKDLNFTLAHRFYGSFERGYYCEEIIDVNKFISDWMISFI